MKGKEPKEWINVLGTTWDDSGNETKTVISMYGKFDPDETKEVLETIAPVRPVIVYWDEKEERSVNLYEIDGLFNTDELIQKIADAWNFHDA